MTSGHPENYTSLTDATVAGEVMSLPMHPYMRPADQERVVNALAETE